MKTESSERSPLLWAASELNAVTGKEGKMPGDQQESDIQTKTAKYSQGTRAQLLSIRWLFY